MKYFLLCLLSIFGCVGARALIDSGYVGVAGSVYIFIGVIVGLVVSK